MPEDDLPTRPGAAAPTARCAVVVPAHDEEAVVAARLRSLTEHLHPGEADVVVVANGCSDATAARAGAVPGVRVLEVARASKTGALNAGDAATSAFPRVYLDADVELTGEALRRLVAALATDRPLVAAPRPRFDVSRSSWGVRSYYAAFTRLPYVQHQLVGLGVYGLSEAGHARLGSFPEVTADDLFVQRLFAADERVVVDAEFVVSAPRTLRALLAVRRRVARGNRQLATEHGQRPTAPGTGAALLRLVARRPHLLPAAVVYAAVTLRARAGAAPAPGAAVWERDTSSRVGAGR
jgi:glycosyltransferase involved in cell wall biosynthesis